LKPSKNELTKSFFDHDETVFLAILIVTVSYQYSSMVKQNNFSLGWCPFAVKLFEA
jgi:hypothetical protein